MKGVVFTEFIEMVEEKFGYDVVDEIINENELESDGIYTAVGTYPHSEIVKLVVSLQKKTGILVPDLLHTFGTYMFHTFTKEYPDFFNNCSNSFEFLNSIDNYIHVQVLKLYPDAELPKFETLSKDKKEMQMVYTSERKMADFALGLIEKTFEFYGEKADVEMIQKDEEGKTVLFKITKK